jgi:hypothetical protein
VVNPKTLFDIWVLPLNQGNPGIAKISSIVQLPTLLAFAPQFVKRRGMCSRA